jgi:hypothetical protein
MKGKKKKKKKLPVFLIYIKRLEEVYYLPEVYNSKEDALEDFPKIKLEYNLNSYNKIGIKKFRF